MGREHRKRNRNDENALDASRQRNQFRSDGTHQPPGSINLKAMAEFHPTEKDPLKWPEPTKKMSGSKTARRIGIHTSIAGGVENAAERAYRLGCTTFQIFSTSPRQWQPYELGRPQCDRMNQLRQKYDLKPLVIHSNYLINLAGAKRPFSPEINLGFSRRAGTRAGAVRGISGPSSRLIPWIKP